MVEISDLEGRAAHDGGEIHPHKDHAICDPGPHLHLLHPILLGHQGD